MAKIKLRDDFCPPAVVGTRLDDECGPGVVVDVLPRATILKRTVIGHSALGDRVFGWQALVTDVGISMMEAREEIVDGIVMVRVKLLLLDPGIEIPSTASIRLQTGIDPDYEDLDVFRITSVSQNGVTAAIEGERVVDGE